MFSLARAVGAGVPFLLGQDMVLLHPITIGDLGAIENYLLQGRSAAFIDAMAAVKTGDEKDRKYRIAAIAEATSIDLTDILGWLSTEPGILMSLWLSLRGSKSWLECANLIGGWSNDDAFEFVAVRNQISAFDSMSDVEWASKVSRNSVNQNEMPNWKRGFKIACDMGQCSLADIGKLTLFQYRSLIASESEVNKPATIPRKQHRRLRQRAEQILGNLTRQKREANAAKPTARS